MQAIIHPSQINGIITAPASKSIMQRACAAALIKKGKSIIYNYGNSYDEKTALEIIQCLGATTIVDNNKICIESNGLYRVNKNIHCNESGLSVRLFTFLAATLNEEITINANGSLLKRPIHFFKEISPLLNVTIHQSNNIFPFFVKGPLLPTNIEINASISSQYLTGLLFAYSAALQNKYQTDSFLNEQICIKANNLNSKPYINLTLQVMKHFGLFTPEVVGDNQFCFNSNNYERTNANTTTEFTVEGDWSNAAFLLVAAAIAGKVKVNGINFISEQADRRIVEVVEKIGCNFWVNNESIQVEKNHLNCFDFDATHCPDLFPPLVALACNCKGISTIKGVNRLLYKESNRAEALQTEFAKMGVEILVDGDIMIIKGGNKIKGSNLNSQQDHRIVMACTVAALNASQNTKICNVEAVNKSYPLFFDHMKKLGTRIELY